MWNQLNSFTKQIAEQATQAVKDAGIDKKLENVSQQMAGGLDKLANSVLTIEEPDTSQVEPTSQSQGLMTADSEDDHILAGTRGTAMKKDSNGDNKQHLLGDVEEENMLLKQRLVAVEAAATEALGELEESNDKLEKASQARSTAEKDLQRAKREITKLRKSLHSSQQAVDEKSSEVLTFKEEVEILKFQQLKSESSQPGDDAQVAEQRAAYENATSVLRKKDEELKSVKKALEEQEGQLSSSESEVQRLTVEIKDLKTAQEVQHQSAKRQGKELENVSKKLLHAVTVVEEKNQDVKLAASSIQQLKELVENLESQVEGSMITLKTEAKAGEGVSGTTEPSTQEVQLQIVVQASDSQVLQAPEDEATRLELEASKSANEALKFELASCQNELEALVESSRELEELVASKDAELVALRHGAKAESNLSLEKLQQVQTKLQEAQDHASMLDGQILDLESKALKWENRAGEVAAELKSAVEKCGALEEEIDRVKGHLNEEQEGGKERESKLKDEVRGEMEEREKAVRHEEVMKAEEREKEVEQEKRELTEKLEKLHMEELKKASEKIDELERIKSGLKVEVEDAKASLLEVETALAASQEKTCDVEKELESERVSGEDRRRKFMMLQTTFKTKEDGLNEEISALELEVARLTSECDSNAHKFESEAYELEDLQKSRESLVAKSDALQARCSELEDELCAREKESSEANAKLQASQSALESLQRENEATIGELRASEKHLRERVMGAESQAREIEAKLGEMDTDLVGMTSRAQSAESRVKAADSRISEAEARAAAAENSKISMTLAMAEMEGRIDAAEEQQAGSSSRQEIEESNADIEALRSKLALAEEESKQLKWQLKMMNDASISQEGAKSTTSWIMGCVSNRKQS